MMNDDDAKNQMGFNIGITVAEQGCGSLQSKEDKKQKLKSKRMVNDKTLDRQPEESKTEVRK